MLAMLQRPRTRACEVLAGDMVSMQSLIAGKPPIWGRTNTPLRLHARTREQAESFDRHCYSNDLLLVQVHSVAAPTQLLRDFTSTVGTT
jgi:hypothetical protein